MNGRVLPMHLKPGQSLKKDFASGLTKKAVDELFLMVILAYLGNLRRVHGSEPG
jgi:hypothetical protein